jgi:taurine dioxygenase
VGVKRSTGWLGELGQRTMPPELRAGVNMDPRIMVLSNVRDSDGKPTGSLGDGEMWFHHDNCFVAKPQKGTALYCVENTVREGGHTQFSNCYLAYESLPKRLKDAVEGRKVLQVYSYSVTGRPDISNLSGVKHYWQPAVIEHPKTGRRALYLDRLMTAAIDGCDKSASDALLSELYPYVERVDYEHIWKPGDFLVWDNYYSAHARTDFEPTGARILKRTTVIGDGIFAASPMLAAS